MDNGPISHFPLPAASPPASFRKSYSFVKVQCDTFVGYYHAVICKNTLIDDLLRKIQPPAPNNPSLPFAIFSSTSDEGNGFGIWFHDDSALVLKCVHGTVSAISGFPIGDLLKADKILRSELELKNSILKLSLENEPLFELTDSTFFGPLTLRRGFVREPSTEQIDLLKEIGQKLRGYRESSFYSERTYAQTEAEEAIQLFDDANEAAAYFFVEINESPS